MSKVLGGVIALLGAIAVAGGRAGGVFGAPSGAPVQRSGVSTDSEYRFISGVWLSLGVIAWWSIRQARRRAAHTRMFLIAAFAGGLSRLVSLLVAGNPGPLFLFALGIELLVVPAVFLWHLSAMRESSSAR